MAFNDIFYLSIRHVTLVTNATAPLTCTVMYIKYFDIFQVYQSLYILRTIIQSQADDYISSDIRIIDQIDIW